MSAHVQEASGVCKALDPAAARSNAHNYSKPMNAQLDRMFSRQASVYSPTNSDKPRLKNTLLTAIAWECGLYVQREWRSSRFAQAQTARSNSGTVSVSRCSKPPPRKPVALAVNQASGSGCPSLAKAPHRAVLAGSALTLDPPGVSLAESVPVAVPSFDHLMRGSLAPAGANIGSKEEVPRPSCRQRALPVDRCRPMQKTRALETAIGSAVYAACGKA